MKKIYVFYTRGGPLATEELSIAKKLMGLFPSRGPLSKDIQEFEVITDIKDAKMVKELMMKREKEYSEKATDLQSEFEEIQRLKKELGLE